MTKNITLELLFSLEKADAFLFIDLCNLSPEEKDTLKKQFEEKKPEYEKEREEIQERLKDITYTLVDQDFALYFEKDKDGSRHQKHSEMILRFEKIINEEKARIESYSFVDIKFILTKVTDRYEQILWIGKYKK